jgi:hypothetical protein
LSKIKEPPHERRACRRLDPHIERHQARPEERYAAFLVPAALIDWLPPAEMTGEIHEFDARVGGGYRMSLFYLPEERVFRGKTSDEGRSTATSRVPMGSLEHSRGRKRS